MEAQERVNREREAIDLLIRTMRLHHRIVERRIDGLGVHHSQHRMLMILSNMGRCASQRDIAEALDVSPACVARMLKPLNASGLIEKAEGSDGRRNEISVSPEGARLVEDSKTLFRQIGSQMFEGLTGEELEALNKALRRVQGNLNDMEGQYLGDGDGRERSVKAL